MNIGVLAVVVGVAACGNGKSNAHVSSVFNDTLVLEHTPGGESIIRGFGFVMPVPAGTTLTRSPEGGVSYGISGPLRPSPERTPEQGTKEPEPIFQVNVSVAGRATAKNS